MSVSLQPKLRFKQDDGSDFSDWEEIFLGKILDFGSGKDYKHLLNGDIPVYGTGGFMTSVNEFLYDGKSVCIGRKGTINKPIFLTGKFWTVDTLFYTRNFKKCIPEFVYLLFQNINWLKYNEASGVPSLSKKTISKITINLPEVIEQQKIASFLSSVDKKIELLTKKHELLEKYKKGLMQKIFSQEMRFKQDDGSDFPDWENKSLSSLCDITTGKLDANAMKDNGEYRFYTCAKDYYYIDNFAFDTEALLISGNGANVGYIHYYKGKFNAYQRTYILDKFSSNTIYTKYYLDRFLKNRIGIEAKAGNTPYIVMSTLSEMDIKVPESKEQIKIASFLSALDKKIDLAKQQIEKTQTFKKGLLQQMFI